MKHSQTAPMMPPAAASEKPSAPAVSQPSGPVLPTPTPTAVPVSSLAPFQTTQHEPSGPVPTPASSRGLPLDSAQTAEIFLIYAWNGNAYAQSIHRSLRLNLGPTINESDQALVHLTQDVYDIASSPLLSWPSDNYGYYHGVWSPDHKQFVHIELQAEGSGYRLQLLTNGEQQLLLEDQIQPSRGYLDPLGWTETNHILLIERYVLDGLSDLRIWS